MSEQNLRIMCVHAHPDDEVIGTGGTLARYSAEGLETVLVIATGGEEGEIVVKEMDTPENHARLREIRDKELACAVAHLGVRHLERLGYRDSGMIGTEANGHPDSFHQADKDAATERLVALVRRYRPHVLVTYDERGGYGHPDHIACHVVTVAAFDKAGDPAYAPASGAAWAPQKLYYTAFPREPMLEAWTTMRDRGMPTPLDEEGFDITQFTNAMETVTTTLPIHDYMAQKQAALACHVTQISTEGAFASIPEDLASTIFGFEHFIRVASRVALPQSEGIEDDLFAGLR